MTIKLKDMLLMAASMDNYGRPGYKPGLPATLIYACPLIN
jgi:hypothetical protein